MVGSLVLRPRSDPVLIRGLSRTLRLRPTVFRADLLRARHPPDSSNESHLLPTRPTRQPAPYASDTSTGVTPPSGPRLISVCIQPSPWAGGRWRSRAWWEPFPPAGSVALVGTPRFRYVLHVALSIHVRSGPFSSCLCCPVGRGTASHGTRPTSPRSRTRLLLLGQLSARPPLFSLHDAPSLVHS